jgi:hypothetical protein
MHRSWFPHILIGLTFILLFAIIAIEVRREEAPVAGEPLSESLGITKVGYELAVQGMFQAYEERRDAEALFESLRVQAVPKEYTDAHLAITLLIGNGIQGGADLRPVIETIKTLYPFVTASM